MGHLSHENNKKFLISSQWWQQWCDYANFDLNQLNPEKAEEAQQAAIKKEQEKISSQVKKEQEKVQSQVKRTPGGIKFQMKSIGTNKMGSFCSRKSSTVKHNTEG